MFAFGVRVWVSYFSVCEPVLDGCQILPFSIDLVIQFSDFLWGGFCSGRELNYIQTSMILSVADSRLIMADTSLMVLGLTRPQPSIKLGVSLGSPKTHVCILVCIDMCAPSTTWLLSLQMVDLCILSLAES